MADFTDHPVNQRFCKVYEALEKLNLIKGKSDLAKKLDTYNHVINSILKGQRNITVDQLQKLFQLYQLNANYLFGISEDMFLPEAGVGADFPTHAMRARRVGRRENITLVPDRALAGYPVGMQDPTYLEGLQKFSVPGYEGNLIAFEISGDSMLPTITNGDIVICEALERGDPIRDNQVYVVVTDTVVAKRIRQIKKDNAVKKLRLISDNSMVFKPYDVELEEVRQLLRVKCRLTSHAIN